MISPEEKILMELCPQYANPLYDMKSGVKFCMKCGEVMTGSTNVMMHDGCWNMSPDDTHAGYLTELEEANK
jgi:hypothetical protein